MLNILNSARRYLHNRKHRWDFIIGDIDEVIAKNVLIHLKLIGMGFNHDSATDYLIVRRAYSIIRFGYDRLHIPIDSLADRWSVDVYGLIRTAYHNSVLRGKLKNKSDNEQLKVCSEIVDVQIIEELSHTSGYKHEDDEKTPFAELVYHSYQK